MKPPRPSRRKPDRRAGWQTRGTTRRAVQPLVIIGAGRLGTALALGLQRARWPVAVFPRSAASLRRAVALGLKIADQELLSAARLCVLAVPDSAIPDVARAVAADLAPDCALIHCAGALSLRAFGDTPEVQQRPHASFHPLVAVSDPEDPLDGAAVALSTDAPELRATLRRMASDLGLFAIEVPEAQRAAYHAGAVLSAGGVVALASAAVDALAVAGIAEADALTALLPLMRSAIRGMEARGLAGGLTGPVVRGDAEVIRAHLAALPPDVAQLYRQLSRRAVRLAQGRLAPEARAFVDSALD